MAAIFMQDHLNVEHPQAAKPRAPTLPQPKLAGQVAEEKYAEFLKEWTQFKTSAGLAPAQIPLYLLSSCESSLKADIQAAVANITELSEEQVLVHMKQHAVITREKSSLLIELMGMKQDQDEPARKFLSRVQAIARNCGLSKPCHVDGCAAQNANNHVNYTDEMVKAVILNGLYDMETRRDVLGTSGISDKTLAQTVTLIQDKETAARSVTHQGTVAGAATSYRQSARGTPGADKRLAMLGKCETCGTSFKNRRLRQSKSKGEEVQILKWCDKCWADRRRQKSEAAKPKKPSNDEEGGAVGDAATSTVFFGASSLTFSSRSRPLGGHGAPGDWASSTGRAMGPKAPTRRRRTGRRRGPRATTAAVVESIPSMTYDRDKGWAQRTEGHGMVELTAHTDRGDYEKFGLRCPDMRPATIQAVADTGCQASLMGVDCLHRLGLQKKDLVKVRANASSINGAAIDVLGVVILRLTGVDKLTGKVTETAAQVRVAPGVKNLYISKQVMRDLGIIDRDFPNVQAAGSSTSSAAETCSCARRGKAPPLPANLPFEPKKENIGKMKEWILKHWASTAFNQCTHRPLPMMASDPIRIHIDPLAKPVAAMTAATVPYHLREAVKQQLDEDVALGTLEKVPIGTPTKWQARMHVVMKPDGKPRRTVDFRHLNDHCLRETEQIVAPYKQARMIPADVWKTKTDAWNGYHSCPLDERDREYTTFITEWGRFRYRSAPQGFLASGDGYNQRYEQLIEDMDRRTRCVDDLCLWDGDLAAHWWRVIRYMDRIANNGIILSPAKFEFCAREIEFAGFVVTDTEVKPLPKYLNAIMSFPRPINISDVRSWFGLVNQVSHYARLTDLMSPFKPFLSPKVKFRWDDELQMAFERSKHEIVESIKEGVKIFDPERVTALSTDYSTTGVGYFMYQQYCSCPSTITTCCPNGWRVTLAGSRFLRAAEKNYSPTEGEAMAVAWALEDSKFFTLGCTRLHVQTDHRPLVKLLGDRTLDEIANRRLVNLKEKTFPWSFSISWVPGRSIPAPDATSRHPQHEQVDEVTLALAAIRIDTEDTDLAGEEAMAAMARNNADTIEAVTWERVQDETSRDQTLLRLAEIIVGGFNTTLDDLPPDIAEYWRFREHLNVIDGVIMYGDRIVVPRRLRNEVLKHLHGAHQGTGQMAARAAASVFWPGITSDMQTTRDRCQDCDKMAPSNRQPHPTTPTFIPTKPFEAICSDYFDLGGTHYLLTVDRLTNWVDVRRAKPKTDESGAAGLIAMCRDTFIAFGVPVEISSDGGPEYKSQSFNDFLGRWGVRHRTSTAYFAQSNGRAEVAVKAAKRALRDNVGEDGSLDNDKYARAMLQLRNTPDRDTKLSPAELLLGRRLRDALPQPFGRHDVLTAPDSVMDKRWHIWNEQENALRHRLGIMVEKKEAKAHDLLPLQPGDHVRVQNQTGNNEKRWDKTGIVREIRPEIDAYLVQMDGSRRLSARNRRFLRKITVPPTMPAMPTPTPAYTYTSGTRGSGGHEVDPGTGPQAGYRAPGDWAPSTGSAIVPQAPAQRSPETPMFRTPMSSPAARPATPADDGWRLDTNTPARPPPARRQVRFPDEVEQVPGPAVARQTAEQPMPPAQESPAAPTRRSTRARTMPAKYRDYEMDMEASVLMDILRQDEVTAGVGGVYGCGHEDDRSVKRDTGQACRPANVTAMAAAAMIDNAPNEIDVSHVVLQDGRLVHVDNLPVVGIDQGRLVVRQRRIM